MEVLQVRGYVGQHVHQLLDLDRYRHDPGARHDTVARPSYRHDKHRHTPATPTYLIRFLLTNIFLLLFTFSVLIFNLNVDVPVQYIDGSTLTRRRGPRC